MFRIPFKALIAAGTVLGLSAGLSNFTAANAQLENDVSSFVFRDSLERGVELFEAGKYVAAEQALLYGSQRRDYAPSPADYAIGLSQVGQEKWRDAAYSLKRAIRLEPENHHARLVLGLVSLKLGRVDVAERQLNQFDRHITSCDDTCDVPLVNAADMLRTAIAVS